jgi:hypothetical protein
MPKNDEREMVLVPRIPTAEMIEEAWAAALAEDAEQVWRVMIETWLSQSATGTLAPLVGRCSATGTQGTDS